jgi:competence protein ComEC
MAGIAVALPYQASIAPAVAAAIVKRTGRQRPWITYVLTWVVSALIVALAATLATWPLVAFNFHRIPLFGIFITMLALPALPLILLGTLATAVAGLVHPAIGQLFGWITWAPLSYLVGLVSVAPKPAVSGAWVGDGLVWTWYTVLVGLLLLSGGLGRIGRLPGRLDRLIRPPAPAGPAAVAPSGSTLGLAVLVFLLVPAVVFLWAQVLSGPDGKLHVYFLDVGQGDSTLIVTPSGRQVLVDGGPDTNSATRSLTGPLSDGDRSLDMVVLTHMDADHSRGLLEVLEHYRVGSVLVGLEQPGSSLYPQWRATLERKRLNAMAVAAGYEILLEPGVTLEVVHPPAEPMGGLRPDPNNNAVVLRLVYGEVSFLLAADIEADAENYLARNGAVLGSTVLKVAHHGSKTSTTEAFLARADPAVAVVSVGEGNRFKHPSPEVLERLGEAVIPDGVFRTDRDGTIEFITNGETLWVRTWR